MRARLLAVATLLGPCASAVHAWIDGDRDLALTAVGAVILVAVAVSRFLAITARYRSAQDRERLLLESAARLVAARGPNEIHAIAVQAAHAIAIGNGAGRAAFGVGDLATMEIVAAHGDDADEMIGRLVDGRPLIHEGNEKLVVFPLTVHGERHGVMSVRAARPLSQPVLDAVRTLGAQVGLALESSVRIEERLERRSEERFRSLVQTSTDVIAIVERDRRIRYHTPSAQTALGYGDDELNGRLLDDLLDERDRGAFLTTFAGALDDDARIGRLEIRLRHRDGSSRTFDVVIRNLVRDPHVGGFVLTAHDVTERRALERRLAHQAFHDPLTGLANRSLFLDRVGHALDRRKRTAATVAALFVDLDEFKTVNDSLGHAAGDELLVAVGERLREATRPVDTAARLGGDEFAVLLEDLVSEDDVAAVAERILSAIARPIRLRDARVSVRASIGIAVASGDETAEDLVRSADTAMYTAKDAGKSRYEVFEPRMHEAARLRLQRLLDANATAA
jgi:diguanylate cyclase (GGDEF)-like protein/PAS domain S-box-containing protein